MHLGRIELKLATPPPHPSPTPDGLAVVGAHGGAGTSTLAALLGDLVTDLGTVTSGTATATDGPLVLVTRCTVAASKHATTAVGLLRDNGVTPVALAVIGDGFPEPRDAIARFALLEGLVGGVVRVPFLGAFRLVDSPTQATPSSRLQRALEQLVALAAAPPSHS